MCYHAEFGRSALKRVDINTKEPQNWGALELRSLEMGGVADPKIHAPTTRVTTSNLVVLPQRVYALVEGNPQIGQRWAPPNWGAVKAYPVKQAPYTCELPCQIWSFCVKCVGINFGRTPKVGECWNSAVLG